jgi:hypothetical protein
LNKTGDGRHLFLIPDYRRKGFIFSPFGLILAIGLS